MKLNKKLKSFIIKGKSRKFGNLERAREVNLPFYDVNPDRVIPRYFEGAYGRLEVVKNFGPNGEMKDKIVKAIAEEGGDYNSFETAFSRIFGVEAERPVLDTFGKGTLQKIRDYEVITKLGLAVIPNSTQSINTAFTVGLKNTLQGIFQSTRKEGQEFAIRTGATLQSTVDDVIRRSTSGSSSWASNFLKATGFSATERMNRTIAANAGRNYINGNVRTMLKNPFDKTAKRRLSELGLNPEKILNRGSATHDELLLGSQSIVNKTQFRSDVLDLPIFFSSPEGKLVTQFKTFAFNQTKLIKDAILKEAARGNLKPMITAVSIMPILGEGVKDVRSVLSGKTRDTAGMERIAENIGAVGSLGILSDLWSSAKFGSVTNMLAGPGISDASEGVTGLILASQGKPNKLQRFVTRQVPIVGPFLNTKLKELQK